MSWSVARYAVRENESESKEQFADIAQDVGEECRRRCWLARGGWSSGANKRNVCVKAHKKMLYMPYNDRHFLFALEFCLSVL